ncbi:cobalt-precorrin-5B (C(1))-methyltransferase CbiD [Vagococcus fessus]|uniref:Cobalt-precorrin-5B C(1)-methyltransferase n=1 Tax=Vagococcus fessus TaxID=120370 RepID=A0A430AD04_9ENTE|nr:cobalt-precorrin-5B (C(1))-methyltransferase CbiD [Vagococcus fessus]RSU05104.1 cobalt-precorrin-5B (C(1))-methyltransferase [Vagococcus fessus]
MEEYVYYNGKKLRKGYTTGTCASAAALAACLMLLNRETIETISIKTASGVVLNLPLVAGEIQEDYAIAAIEKDGGDDADATHEMWIYAKVTLNDIGEIVIDGGDGIGRVTQPGLAIPEGQAAINPVPRKMIKESLLPVLPKGKGADVLIYAPEGEERGKLTFNSRLGIVGGISILGTTGIVTPMSEEGWKASITIELEMKYKQGLRRIILTPGNYGEDFVKNEMGIPTDNVVNMSNFVGYVLNEVQRIGFEEVLMVGHIGKFIKIAAGIFSTHSKDADGRTEILIANLALLGAPVEMLKEVAKCTTTEAAGDIIVANHYEHVYQVIVDKIKQRSELLLRYKKRRVTIEAIMFSSQRGLLASTKPLEELEVLFK